jgi:ABC-type multidrug transport system fused ATPase/permease subunit
MADKIIVLDGGVVQEIGSHTDLMEKDGLYASMCRMQASQYGL